MHASHYFEYRALDLLADYDSKFVLFPGIWHHTIRTSGDIRVHDAFGLLVRYMTAESIEAMSHGMTEGEFCDKLGFGPSERDEVAIKMYRDLGIGNNLNAAMLTYFSARRNVLEDERAWVRFTEILREQLDIQAC